MATVTTSEVKLKELLKVTLAEVLEERKDFLRDVVEEAMEDIALARAIEEGKTSREVSRASVMRALKSGK